MKNQPLNLIFMGTAEFAVPVLEKLVSATNWRLAAIYTKPDKPQGRGMETKAPPIKQWFLKNQQNPALKNTLLHQPADFKNPKTLQKLAQLKPDLIIVAIYGMLLPNAVLEMPRLGCINVHPSLLPKYRGPAPIQAPILNQDQASGVTIIKLVEKMDAGPIINQTKIPLPARITAPQLHDQLAELSAELLVKTIPQYAAGALKPRPQDEKKATFTKLVKKTDGLLSWNEPAEKIDAKIRALAPWPGTYTFFKKNGRSKSNQSNSAIRLNILSARPITDEKMLEQVPAKPAGTFIVFKNTSAKKSSTTTEIPTGTSAGPKSTNKKPAVICAPGVLELIKVQPEGKKPMNGTAFINGYLT